jgi:transposase InsO family protein
MDLFVGLPQSTVSSDMTRGYDAILVFVDRLTKYVGLAPTYTDASAEDMAIMFHACAISSVGVPDTIITDRAHVCVGKFSTELNAILGITHNPTTAYHPQTDGQTERFNAVLGDMRDTHHKLSGSNTWPAVRSFHNSFHFYRHNNAVPTLHRAGPQAPTLGAT